MLEDKIYNYEKFFNRYPGFGGYLPSLDLSGDGDVNPKSNVLSSTENGELFWAIYGMVEVLDVRYASKKDLSSKWKSAYETMSKNSVAIFYEGDGKIRR